MIPVNAKRIAIRPLALGEVTGHHHSLMTDDPELAVEDAVEMYEYEGNTYVRIKEDGVRLVHQEHKASVLPVGDYVITVQQENTDWGKQRVAD